jgi:hypothetical protein
VAMKQVVLLTARALSALEAANEQKRHPDGHQDGQQICIRHEPVKKCLHNLLETYTQGRRPRHPTTVTKVDKLQVARAGMRQVYH